MNHEYYMRKALTLAKTSFENNEVPVGSVVVYNNEIIGYGYNNCISDKNPISHAEINSLIMASKSLKNWRLDGCILYTTLEPCMMCMGAMINARIQSVYYGTKRIKKEYTSLNISHNIQLHGEILEEECSVLIKDFFKQKR